MANVELEGMEEIAKVLGKSLTPTINAIVVAVAAEAQDRIAPYPPAGEANRPKDYAGGLWYERGYGTRWRRADGSIGGRKTSETLGRRWNIKKGNLQATLENRASYAGFVHDADDQAWFHHDHGWKTDEGVADQIVNDGIVARMAEQALKKALGL